MGKTSKIMPKWMQPIHNSKIITRKGFGKNNKDPFLEKPLKSVFSIMDYRHNLATQEDSLKYMKDIPKEPKKFFNFDDGTRFVPSKSIDIKVNDKKDYKVWKLSNIK